MLENSVMKNNNYDEYQMMIRYKYGYYAFFIMMILTLINQFVVAHHVWASPFVQTLVIIHIVSMYLTTMYIFKNAYISKKERNPFVTIGSTLFLGIINWAYIILWRPNIPFYKDYYLQDNIVPLLMAIFFSYISLVLLIHYFISKKKEQE